MAPVSTQAPTATPAAVAANVVILCVFFDGLVKTTEADEYVVVLNQGSAAAQLEGWQLIGQSDGAPQFVFPVFHYNHRLLCGSIPTRCIQSLAGFPSNGELQFGTTPVPTPPP